MPTQVLPKPPTKKPPAVGSKGKLAALLRFDKVILNEIVAGTNPTDPGFSCVLGLDEVGRGSLIGPVVAAAVCMPDVLSRPDRKALGLLNDSKQLRAEQRAQLDVDIRRLCHFGIGQAEKDEVDRLNVHYASLLALHRAYRHLLQTCELGAHTPFLIMDGRAVIPDLPREIQKAVIKGDGKSAAIAAASIVAKEHRDRMIRQLARDYPGYGWETNMGYGTPEHQDGIRRLGLTPLHRLNYRAVRTQLELDFAASP